MLNRGCHSELSQLKNLLEGGGLNPKRNKQKVIKIKNY
ncbi:hypothetical protein SASC598J21_001350, partial [Snodgrassella alvi SCGC AB-598-J21]